MNADGWTHCAQGHRHWGLVGAAGLLVVHDAEAGRRFLMQHRSEQVHHGGTWAIPGGALAYGESVEDGAMREATEELADLPAGLDHLLTYTDDHGGWTYSTLVVRSDTAFAAVDHGWETGLEGFAWLSEEEIAGIPLHAGFAASWSAIVELID